jgi:osmoprotectant transport system ATP-binding protein
MTSCKTVIFVTHDIDEAIKMGDRIAIMRDGHLVQMATADDLLAAPADDFVANFVGADRGLKRLRVRPVSDIELDPATDQTRAGEPTVTPDTTLHYALSTMLAEGTTRLDVVDDRGSVLGSISLDAITKLIGPAESTGDPQPTAVGGDVGPR